MSTSQALLRDLPQLKPTAEGDVPGPRKLELFFEAKNLFNKLNIAGVNRVVTTDANGVPATAVSTPAVAVATPGALFSGNSAYDQRIMQLGFKFIF